MRELCQKVAKDLGHTRDLSGYKVVVPTFDMLTSWRRELPSAMGGKAFLAPYACTMDQFLTTLNTDALPTPYPHNTEEETEEFEEEVLSALYRCYEKVVGKDHAQPLSTFAPWLETVLKDFDEADKALVNPEKLFLHISAQKGLEEDISYMEPEAQDIVRQFWNNFKLTKHKDKIHFQKLWNHLYPIYRSFQEHLDRHPHLSYRGRVYRRALENVKTGKVRQEHQLLFVGFSALTPVEEEVIRFFVQQKTARVYWRVHANYVEDSVHSAGLFFRKYRRDNILGPTFTDSSFLPSKPVHTVIESCASVLAQVRKVGHELLSMDEKKWGETVLVLPEAGTLYPLMHHLPLAERPISLHVKYPLSKTLLPHFLEAWWETVTCGEKVPLPVVKKLLTHPYLKDDRDLSTLASLLRSRGVCDDSTLSEHLPTWLWPDRKEVISLDVLLRMSQGLLTQLEQRSKGLDASLFPEHKFVESFCQRIERWNESPFAQALTIKDLSFLSKFVLNGQVLLADEMGNHENISKKPLIIASIEAAQAFPTQASYRLRPERRFVAKLVLFRIPRALQLAKSLWFGDAEREGCHLCSLFLSPASTKRNGDFILHNLPKGQ